MCVCAYVGAMNAPLQKPSDRARKPDWIRVKAPTSPGYAETRKLMR
jgi:lipoic acid synthetase